MHLLSFCLFMTCAACALSLKCYVGSQNASYPLTGVPMDCPAGAMTCQKQFDRNTNTNIRQCSNYPCILNGQNQTNGACFNDSATLVNCCCYGDGCNQAPAGIFSLPLMLLGGFAGALGFSHWA